MDHRPINGYLFGALAAVTFGISAPVAQQLVSQSSPVALAGVLYLSAGLSLALFRLSKRGKHVESPIRRTDWLPLATLVISGGFVGPAFMLYGLSRISGVTGALLLNLEAPLTMLFAVVFFREHIGRTVFLGALLICGAAAVLSAGSTSSGRADVVGVASIVLACSAWALDNNLTQRLGLRDPLIVVTIKTTAAGIGNVLIALGLGHSFPPLGKMPIAVAIGVVSYGLSVLLDAYALRILGALREAAIFATAPFVGAAVAFVFFGQPAGLADVLSAAVMLGGVWLLVREKHEHTHTHEPVEHEHTHTHDEHHQHAHDGDVVEPHSHVHRHDGITHEHPHTPDAHHRHRH